MVRRSRLPRSIQAGGNLANVWTPLDKNYRRLRIAGRDVKVIVGDIGGRGLGLKGFVKAKGKYYMVEGYPCGMPDCNCDARWIEISADSMKAALKVWKKGMG